MASAMLKQNTLATDQLRITELGEIGDISVS